MGKSQPTAGIATEPLRAALAVAIARLVDFSPQSGIDGELDELSERHPIYLAIQAVQNHCPQGKLIAPARDRWRALLKESRRE